ncbi:DUF397 domain-containing protein [Streptomyces sp. CB01635]|nr:DUF397 domain-containing protein [Streptomyces sp. CB01635]PJN08804.1 DUF397 domain-containing protein [Streptomyces sp. CB01635]
MRSGRPGRSGTVHVRDSKNRRGPQLAFSDSSWRGSIAYAAYRS